MSKTLDPLKKHAFSDEVLNDHIVKTYFTTKSRQKSRKKKSKSAKKYVKIGLLALPLIILTGFLLAWGLTSFQKNCNAALLTRLSKASAIRLVDGGWVNRDIIKRFEFRGNARGTSKFSRQYITLNNPKKYNWADLSFDFRVPIDLSNRNLLFSTKGAIGGEKISVIFRDANNRALRSEDIYLSSTWRAERIGLQSASKYIDLTKITHMRLECNYVGDSPKETDSPINISVQLKDIQITKKEI